MPKPTATLPTGIFPSGHTFSGTAVDTSYTAPSGAVFACHTATDLKNALSNAQQGDVIELDAGVVYQGNFVVPAKAQNGQWLHIRTAGFQAKHALGTRVTPADAVDMAAIVSPNASQALSFAYGPNHASHIRIYGIEFYSNSAYAPGGYTPGRKYGYALIAYSGTWPPQQPVPDHIIFDRIYLHGDDTHDLQAGIQANWNYGAVIDSHISDIHMAGTDTTAYGGFFTLGPHKIVNNHLSAAGENIIFGGSGGNANPGVPSDIEIRFNHVYKPLSWVAPSLASPNVMVVKNSIEFKSAQRVLVSDNVIENCWAAGQLGFAIVLTTRSGQSGDFTVINDITIQNNVLLNVCSGFNTLASDDTCNNPGANPPTTTTYPNCGNAGSQDHWVIVNNLIIHLDPSVGAASSRNLGVGYNNGYDHVHNVSGLLKNFLYQHNTQVSAAGKPAWNSIFFATPTDNIWVLDNVFTRQPSGNNGPAGQALLTMYMPTPTTPPDDNQHRYTGNVMDPVGMKDAGWPAGNIVQVPTFVDPTNEDYTLASPQWTSTSDGVLAGVDMSLLPAFTGGSIPPPNPIPPAPPVNLVIQVV